ncbi:MAG: dTDP-glucose 4,6-dehydratase [Kineosporiaceae bacterium]
MRIVVTGGAGFIGSTFARRVLTDTYPALAGAHVVVLDALTCAGTLTNLAAVAGSPRLTFVEGDVCDARRTREVVDGADAVVHLAAESHVDRSIADPSRCVVTNVVGTQTVLEAVRRAGVGRVVHVSTDEVYGPAEVGDRREGDPLHPSSPYAAGKAAADLVALSYSRTYGTDVVVTRGSNTYGPHQLPDKLVPLFATRLLDGGRVPLYGDGLHVRDWLHVDDHCRAVALVLTAGRAGEVYNVSGGTELTNLELTRRLLAATGRDASALVRVADRPGHDRRYGLDGTKIREELGFVPEVPFDDGLARTVEWYRTRRDWWEPLTARTAPPH